MKALRERLAVLIRARYPLLMLLTHEEIRAERMLGKLAEGARQPMYLWSCAEGLVSPDGEPEPGTQRPVAALDAIGVIPGPALFVLRDVHPFLDDPEVVRRLRSLTRTVGRRRQAITLISPVLRIPDELAKEMLVLDVPLPGREEISRLLAVLLRSQNIDTPPELFERFIGGSLGLTEEEIKRLFARILLAGGGFSEADLSELVEEKRKVIRRSRFLEFWSHPERMENVGGMDNLKGWLRRRAAGFSPEARAYGLAEPRGLFMLGVQGCGKSLMAKAVADLWRLPLLRLDVAAVFGSRSGREEDSLRETVRVAESLAPAVLWIDEIEKGFAGRGDAGGEAFGAFLTWMQEKQKPVFVVATANEVRVLPPELLRKGRFDEIFFVDLPDVHERLSILDIHLRRRSRDPHRFGTTQIAEETDRMSGAELEQIVVGAMFRAFAEDREVDTEDMLEVAREMVPLAVTMDDALKELREWARPRARPASLDRRRIDFFEGWDESG